MASNTIYLKLLLCNLPEELPIGTSNAFPFINFVPNEEGFEEGLTAAIVKVFKDVFGWQDAGELAQNGPLILSARGANVAAAATILSTYLKHEDCISNAGPLQQWIEKLTKITLNTFKHYNKEVCTVTLIVVSQLTYFGSYLHLMPRVQYQQWQQAESHLHTMEILQRL